MSKFISFQGFFYEILNAGFGFYKKNLKKMRIQTFTLVVTFGGWMFFVVAALLSGGAAHADEGVVPNIDVEFLSTVQMNPQQEFAPTLKITTRSKRDAYVYLDGQVATAGTWQGRLGAGVDMLGKMPVDLTIGGFVGASGGINDPSMQLVPAGGGEVSLGAELGRLRGAYRWRVGASRTPVSLFLMENELDVGVRIVSTLRIEGRYIHSLATEDTDGHSFGLGLSYTF
jgi:hypothetical protein